mgnify:CR=1 FL=1
MRTYYPIANLYTEAFKGYKRLIDTDFIGYIGEIVRNNNTEPYRAWLERLLKEYGNVWGYILNYDDISDRLEQVCALVSDIRANGYSETKREPLYIVEGKIYGGITCYKQRDMILIDGHHAVSILYHLGHESVPIIVTKYENTALPS